MEDFLVNTPGRSHRRELLNYFRFLASQRGTLKRTMLQ